MTPGHRLQRKVVGMISWRTWRVVMALLLVLPLAGACKKKGPRPGEGAGAGAAGLGEEGLTGTGSSLERAKRGLGPGKEGGAGPGGGSGRRRGGARRGRPPGPRLEPRAREARPRSGGERHPHRRA